MAQYAQDFLKAVAVGRPPNIVKLFPNSKALIVSGKVIEINQTLVDTPEVLNESPYTEGWLVRVQVTDETELDKLMDAPAYDAYCQER